MLSNLKIWCRRHRFFKKGHAIQKSDRVRWTPEDSNSVYSFFCENTGEKLLTALDDLAYNAVVGNRCNPDYINGILDCIGYIKELGVKLENRTEKGE